MSCKRVVAELKGVSKGFSGKPAITDLTVAVYESELFGFVGPDGAGKTTTLRLLAGLLAPDSGTVAVMGADMAKEPDKVKRMLGYMARSSGLYPDLTVEENIAFYAELYGVDRNERRQREQELLRLTGLEPFRKRLAGQLSGGMKQKLALICVLIHHPRIILLDEPTVGIDPVSRRELWILLAKLVRNGLTIILATSYQEEAEFCDRVGLLYAGRLVQCSSPQGLKEVAQVRAFEVATADPFKLREQLALAASSCLVRITGGRLRILCPSHWSREQLFERVHQVGVQQHDLRESTLNMEDVVLVLLKKSQLELKEQMNNAFYSFDRQAP